MAVMFFLSPFVVSELDPVSYGIWGLLNVLTGYMGLFDIGVRSSVGRHVALYLGKGDNKGVDETVRAGLGFFSLVGVLIVIAGIIVGWFFPQFFKQVPPEHFDTVRLLLPLMVLNVWFSAVAAIYSSVLAAYDRFDVASGVDFLVLIVRTGGTVAALVLNWNLWGMAFSVLAGNILAVVGNLFLARQYHHGLKSWPFLYSRPRLKELINYGVPASVSRAAQLIIGQTDLLIVGAVLSVASVREYSVGAMLVYYSSTFLALIAQTLFPAVQRSVAAGRLGEARHLFGRQVRVTLCFGLIANLGMALYAKPFIHLWMFQDGFDELSVSVSAGVMAILAVSKLPQLFIQPCTSLLSAMGHVRFTAGVTLLEAIVNIACSIFFAVILSWGLYGVAAGTLVARLFTSSLFIPIFLCKKIKISFSSFLARSVLPGFLAGALISAFGYGLLNFWSPDTWPVFFVQVFFITLVWVGVAGVILLPKDYRQRIWGKVGTFITGVSIL